MNLATLTPKELTAHHESPQDSVAASPESPVAARIGVFSVRHLNSHVCRCSGYELEDQIATWDSAELLLPRFVPLKQSWWEHRARLAMERLFGFQYIPRLKEIQPILSDKRFELFFIFCQNENDIRYLKGFSDWSNKGRVTACWIDELWLHHAQTYPKQTELLRPFDFLFLTFRETANYLRDQGLNAFYIPPGVDTVRYCPYPHFPERTIDVMAMGRKAPKTHRRLLELSESGRIHYVFDTSTLPNIESAFEHRGMMANQIKRTKLFLVQKAKADEPNQTKGQVEIGSRFFEGVAAGAVLVGDLSDSPAFQDHFNWEDAIIRLPYDSDEIDRLFEVVGTDRTRMSKIQRQNVIQSLLRHDWVYRWEFILKTIGLDITSAMMARKEKLAQIAAFMENRLDR
jgi:hypothetical protein